MTDEEKKEFEEFLQWKAEKKKKEEEEKREQEKLEKLAEQAKQERLVAEQATAKQQATLLLPTNGQMRKVSTINLYRKLYSLYVVS